MQDIIDHLKSLGWTGDETSRGTFVYTSPDKKRQVEIDGNWWMLSTCANEGRSLSELIKAGVF